MKRNKNYYTIDQTKLAYIKSINFNRVIAINRKLF